MREKIEVERELKIERERAETRKTQGQNQTVVAVTTPKSVVAQFCSKYKNACRAVVYGSGCILSVIYPPLGPAITLGIGAIGFFFEWFIGE